MLYIDYQSIQFYFGFIPVNGSGRIYPTLTAIPLTPTLHLTRFMASVALVAYIKAQK